MSTSTPKRKFYIAGPMRGYEYYNYWEFEKAEKILKDMGHDVINPHKIDQSNGIDVLSLPKNTNWNTIPKNLDMNKTILDDVSAILSCTDIFMLKNWDISVGAGAEHRVARWAGLKIHEEGRLCLSFFNKSV